MIQTVTPNNIVRATVTFTPDDATVIDVANVKAWTILNGTAVALTGIEADGGNVFHVDITVPDPGPSSTVVYQVRWECSNPIIGVQDPTSRYQVSTTANPLP